MKWCSQRRGQGCLATIEGSVSIERQLTSWRRSTSEVLCFRRNRERTMILLFWSVLAAFAIAETCVVFWVPLFADSPPIFSSQNVACRKRAVLVHCLILAAYLGVVGFLFWSESSFNWLSHGGISLQRAFGLLLGTVMTGTIERELFFRSPRKASTHAATESGA